MLMYIINSDNKIMNAVIELFRLKTNQFWKFVYLKTSAKIFTKWKEFLNKIGCVTDWSIY